MYIACSMMWRIVFRLMCSCSTRRTVDLRSCCSAAHTAAMLSSGRLVQGCPTHSSSCTSSQLSRNLPNDRNVVARDTHSSLYTFRSNSYVSVPVLPAFQKWNHGNYEHGSVQKRAMIRYKIFDARTHPSALNTPHIWCECNCKPVLCRTMAQEVHRNMHEHWWYNMIW